MSNLKQNVEEIVGLLRCVSCGGTHLEMRRSDPLPAEWSKLKFALAEQHLCCPSCGARFPVSEDGIPILWTDMIKGMLLSAESAQEQQKGDEFAAVYSNITSYDRISDDYAANWRKSGELIERLRVAARRLLSSESNKNSVRHLDVGCGPGHVIEWLKPLSLTSVGLDVSLNNLRNARKGTGAYVVLGDATNMPFKDKAFGLVTGSAILHHIYDWQMAIVESCRVCSPEGGVVYDSEPTVESLDLSPIARAVFEARWPVYKLLSYFLPSKRHFRNAQLAKQYYYSAEVHNQPGRGISTKEVEASFGRGGFIPEIFLSPSIQLSAREQISAREAGWKRIVLQGLSGHDPRAAKYGTFTVLARPRRPPAFQ